MFKRKHFRSTLYSSPPCDAPRTAHSVAARSTDAPLRAGRARQVFPDLQHTTQKPHGHSRGEPKCDQEKSRNLRGVWTALDRICRSCTKCDMLPIEQVKTAQQIKTQTRLALWLLLEQNPLPFIACCQSRASMSKQSLSEGRESERGGRSEVHTVA
jgi:hypothetical protein